MFSKVTIMDTAGAPSRLDRLLGFLKHDPDNLPLLRDAADEALQRGLWSQAYELVQRALALAPNDSASRYRMAVILSQQGQAAASLEFSQALIAEGVQSEALLYQHARSLVLAGRHLEAEPLLASLKPHAAELPEFDYFYLRSLHAAGKLDEAIAIAAGLPQDPVAQGMLSLMYIDGDQLDQGRQLALQVLEQDPGNIDALLAAGTGLMAMEESDAALPAFEEAARLHPDSGRAWMGMGLARLSNGDFEGAREALQKTVALMPSHLGSWNALAWVQLLQNDNDGAAQTLETALRVDRNFGETHGTLAVLKAAQQDWTEAKHQADIAVRLQPESFAGRFAQSLLLQHRGRPEQGARLLQQIMRNYSAPAGGNLIDVVRRYTARHGQKRQGISKAASNGSRHGH